MPAYVITCPVCKQRYKAMNVPSTPQPFVCKKCGYTAMLGTAPPTKGVTNSEATAAMPSGKTRLAPSTDQGTKVIAGGENEVKAYLTISGTGAKLVLTPGVYIMGRKSSDSNATLQLAPDITMSRQHVRIAVQSVGGKVMSQIIGLKAANPVIVNGKVLPAGQPLTLKSGDRLQLGNTIVVYTV